MRENLANQLIERKKQQELVNKEKKDEFKKYRDFEDQLAKEKLEGLEKEKEAKERYMKCLKNQMTDKFFYKEPEKEKHYLDRDYGYAFTEEEIAKASSPVKYNLVIKNSK